MAFLGRPCCSRPSLWAPDLDLLIKEFPEHLKIPSSELHGSGKLIGRGTFSYVRVANWLRCDVAIKHLPIHDVTSFKSYLQELGILMRLPHLHVVQLLGFNVSSRRVSIVMERLETTLYHVITNRRERLCTFPVCEALDIMWKISLGIKFLHSRGVTHGGLSPGIILMNVHAEGKFDVKIGGFAFSHNEGQLPISINDRFMYDRFRFALASKTQEGKVHTDGQMIQRVTKAADVFGFAFICYAILTGCLPPPWFEMASEDRPELPSNKVDVDLAELIRKCWDATPENRPEISDICNTLAEFRAARDIQVLQETAVLTEDGSALRWTTHKDDEDNTCLEIASILETLPNHLSIDPVDVKWRRCIGEGGYNKVYEVDWLGCTFAMKRYKVLSASLKEEMGFLVKLRHPHIAPLIGVTVDNNGGWIMMERMDMDLRNLIDSRVRFLREAGRKSTRPFCEAEIRELCLKIALGMNFLHSRKVIHRDVKAANVLVQDHGGRFDVKITDFGVSHRIGNPNVANSAGTGFWRAPEVLKAKSDKPITEEQLKKTDVYSYAMTCYEIITGMAPFEEKVVDAFGRDFPADVRSNNVIQGCRPKLPAELKGDLVKLISDCWNDDPAKRPEFSTICKVLDIESTWNSNPVALLDRFVREKWFLFNDGLRRKRIFSGLQIFFRSCNQSDSFKNSAYSKVSRNVSSTFM